MSRFSGDEDDMAAARARHAADEMRWMREDQKAGEEMWRAGERRRRTESRRPGSMQTGGPWVFLVLQNESGDIVGWRAEYNGKICGMLTLMEDDLAVFGGSDNPYDETPSAEEILRAFLHLYPSAPRRRIPAGQRALPR